MGCTKEYWGLEFSPEEIARCKADKGLLSLELELSRLCNLRCIYCYASSGQALADELSLSEISTVIDQAADLGAKKIIILGGGEPLLYPHLLTVIDYIRSRHLAVDLFTNATLINPAMAEALYQRQVAISMKMNSRRPEVQDALAAKPGTFQAIAAGLSALQAAGYPDDNHTLGIETIICGHNYEELPDLWRWARRRNIIPYFEVLTSQGRALAHDDLEVAPAALKRLFEELAAIDYREFGHSWTPRPPLAGSHCARHEYSCTITAIGDVQPCPGVSIATGNIRHAPLAEILHSSHVIKELRNIRQTIKGQCGQCRHGDFCYGCRGNAFQVTGDHLAADPTCWLK
ncbi:MAG: radical SAM/SPASM domain-containing protein [Desulfobulbaceae bacterium]|nr:MAG: radical SAM/SPASM domain-containing protein [Desulfobulbaceae bacterium]